MKRPILSALATLLFAAALNAAEPAAFPVRNGDSPVVFIGDSITEQRLYTALVESYLLTRFPDWKLTFRNSGWSGDTMNFRLRGGPENGFKRDILPLKPALALINFGMNDARLGESNITAYTAYTRQLVAALTNIGSRIVLLTPSPEERYEPGQPGGSAYNTLLRKYADALAAVSEETGMPLVNQLEPFISCIESGRQAGVLGAAADPRLIPDGIHPNPAGHLVMAASILKGMKAPALVSRLEIDAAAGAILKAEGCAATIGNKVNGVLPFTRTDACLPWGIPEAYRLALDIPGFTALNDLNQYLLTVKGLAPGAYQLDNSKVTVGVWTADQLAAGINLATSTCAVVQQALALHGQVISKNALFFERWRNVQLGKVPEWVIRIMTPESFKKVQQTELDRLDAAIIKAEEQINALRQPKPQDYTLRPVEALP